MKRAILVLLCIPALAWGAPPDWQQSLSPDKPGSFPEPPALKARYKFGWMALSGGAAEAVITKPRNDILQLDVSGGSTGVVRRLWKFDATHEAEIVASTLQPLRIRQMEDYGWDKVNTDVTFTDKGAMFVRRHTSSNLETGVKQQFLLPGLHDLFTALLYIRSQRLQPGDEYKLAVFPAKSAYLATVKVAGRENIEVPAGKYNALKFEIRLQRINYQLGLETHSKFKRAFVWISDDENRILLRVDAEIFVGSVWMELQSIKEIAR